jgi:uncharacterized protein involved in exopolysaccharide biosynthesis
MNFKRVPSSKKHIDVQANTAILVQLEQNLELAKITLKKGTPLIQLTDKPVLPMQNEKDGKLQSLISGGFLEGFLVILFLVE